MPDLVMFDEMYPKRRLTRKELKQLIANLEASIEDLKVTNDKLHIERDRINVRCEAAMKALDEVQQFVAAEKMRVITATKG